MELIIRQHGNDDAVLWKTLFTSMGAAGAHVAAYQYETLCEVGIEEPEINARGVRIIVELDKVMRSGGLENREKGRVLRDDFLRNIKDRSMGAIRHTLEQADALYRQGKIGTRNAAIVIGTAHFMDYYEEIIKADIQGTPREYNAVFIFARDCLGETVCRAWFGEEPECVKAERIYEWLKKQWEVPFEE